jgi:hypothetical protein
MNKQIKKTWNIIELDKTSKVTSLVGNRPIDKAHVSRLKESMKTHGVLVALTVMRHKKSYIVLDGHHRWEAAKSLGYSMPAIIVPKGSGTAVVELNTVSKNWQLADFAHYYSLSGNEEQKAAYSKIMEYAEKTDLNYTTLVAIFGHPTVASYKKGNFRITSEVFAKKFIQYLKDIKPYIPFSSKSRFVSGYLTLATNPKYDHKRMLAKLRQKHKQTIEGKSNPTEYGKLMQTIYNYNVKDASKLVMFNSRW